MNLQTKLALRYLSGRKLRTTLTTLSIVFGVMLIFGLNGMLPALQDSFRQNLLSAAGAVDLTITSVSGGTFDAAAMETVRAHEQTAHTTGSLARSINLPISLERPNDGALPITSLTLVGIDAETAQEVRPLTVKDGRLLQPTDTNSILISQNLADQEALAVGDSYTLPAAAGAIEYEVVGILGGMAAAASEKAYTPLSTAQEAFNLPGQINVIEAIFAAGTEVEATRASIVAALGDGFKSGGNESGAEIMAALEMGKFVYTMFGVTALAMGGFIIYNSFRTSVLERRRDIGMLRAIGGSRGVILGMVLVESLLQGIIGTILGLIAGYYVAAGMLAAIGPMWQDMMQLNLGGPSFAPYVYVLSVGLGVGVTLLGGLFPALSASRMSPLEALRPSAPEVEQRRAGKTAVAGAILVIIAFLTLTAGNVGMASLGILLFMAGLTMVTPVLVYPIARIFGGLITLAFAREGRIAKGNMTRQPGRSAVTISTMTIGLAIIVALAGLISSMNNGMVEWIDESLGADYLFMPRSLLLGSGNVGANAELAQSLRDTPGVAVVTTLRQTTTRADGVDLQLIGIDPVTYPQVAGLAFDEGNEAEAYAALGSERALIINGIFAAQNGVEMGQNLTINTAEGAQTYRVAGIGSDFLNMKLATGYISHANLAQDFHETSDLLLMADQEAGADTAVIEAAFEEITANYPAFTMFTAAGYHEELQSTLLSKLNSTYVLLFVVAVPSLLALVNTLSMNVMERRREIGVMRAVGATQKQVRRMILAESLLLAGAGIAFGILAGLWLSYIMVAGMDAIGFNFPFSFPYMGIWMSTAVGLIFAIIGALLPARQAARLVIVDALAYE